MSAPIVRGPSCCAHRCRQGDRRRGMHSCSATTPIAGRSTAEAGPSGRALDRLQHEPLPVCRPLVRPFSSGHWNDPCGPKASILLDRRAALAAMLCAAGMLRSASAPQPAAAFTPPPPGFRLQVDKLDGYSFIYPSSWLAVTVTGNDCFFRNPINIDENLFVDLSSPSSSQYVTVTDLGTPEQTANSILEQYLNKEFMSTRIGIKREGQVVSATSRQGSDGRTYYDITIRMTSYASRSPYVATRSEVMKDYGLEWDRVLLTTLGVANKRLYELRLQTAQSTLDSSLPVLTRISQSFTLKDVEEA